MPIGRNTPQKPTQREQAATVGTLLTRSRLLIRGSPDGHPRDQAASGRERKRKRKPKAGPYRRERRTATGERKKWGRTVDFIRWFLLNLDAMFRTRSSPWLPSWPERTATVTSTVPEQLNCSLGWGNYHRRGFSDSYQVAFQGGIYYLWTALMTCLAWSLLLPFVLSSRLEPGRHVMTLVLVTPACPWASNEGARPGEYQWSCCYVTLSVFSFLRTSWCDM